MAKFREFMREVRRALAREDPARSAEPGFVHDPLLGRLDAIAQDETLPSHVQIAAHDATTAIRSLETRMAPTEAAFADASRRLAIVTAERDEARVLTSCSLCQSRFGVPAADTATQDPCPTCNGDGESDESPLLPCPDCWGSGTVPAADTVEEDGEPAWPYEADVPAADTATQPAVPPTWHDGTVRLPEAIEAWLDCRFAGEKDDNGDELTAQRNATAVAFWSLMYRHGDPETDNAALAALLDVAADTATALCQTCHGTKVVKVPDRVIPEWCPDCVLTRGPVPAADTATQDDA